MPLASRHRLAVGDPPATADPAKQFLGYLRKAERLGFAAERSFPI